MLQGTHVAKPTNRDNYSNLLNKFGEEIKDWAIKNKGGPFPEHRKWFMYSHIQWKPISTPLNPDLIPPNTAHVIGQEMGLTLSTTQKQFDPWLIVKNSEMGKKTRTGKKSKKVSKKDDEYDPGLGLFAARQFLIHDVITVYFGVRTQEVDTDESRRLEVGAGKFIDVLADQLGKRPLYFGAHFAHISYIRCKMEEDYTKYKKKNLAGKNENCIIDGCCIRCISRIEQYEELRLDYSHST